MIPLHRLIFAALGAFVFVVQALAQPTPVAVAAGADLIAVSSQHVERQLLRLHFDRAAAKVSLVPFGPPGVEIFAVAPGGAYVVYSATLVGVGPVSHLFMLDDTGRALGKPVRSPIGAVAGLAVSPWGDRGGDRIAASSERGWMALLAVEGTGPSRRLALRTMFGVSADRPFTSAFRPEGGLVTMTDDWVATYRSPDGAVQHTLDLKTANPDLTPADRDIGSLFQLTWSPRGDRFAVSWGPGPMVTTIFDSAGHRLRPGSAPGDLDLPASKVEFVEGGDAMLLYGMTAPLLVRMKSLAATAFGDPALSVERFVSLAGGRTIAQLAGDRIALWSAAGKRLTQPVGLENYKLGAAAAGATDEVLVAAERGGWVDLYTRDGKFLRRAQSGVRSSRGDVAVSADGAVIAALGAADLGVLTQPGSLVWGSALASEGAQDCFVAIAASGSRIVAAGPDAAVRSWSRDGADPLTIALDAAGQAPRRLSGLAVSTGGDAIAIADEGSAVWLVQPDDRRVTRVAQAAAARSVTALPDGSGFAVGLADGMVLRLSRDGAVRGSPVKVFELGGVRRIVVAPDGESFIAVDDDEITARHLAWEGRAVTGPVRARQFELIKGAFFQGAAPQLVIAWRNAGLSGDESFGVVDFAPPGRRQVKPLDPPRPQ